MMLAIPWYFADVLGKPSLFGILFTVVTFLTLFWSLYSGTLIDRYSRKHVFLGLNLIAGLLIGGITLTGYQTGAIPVTLIGLAFTITVFNFNIHYPNLYALAQEITPEGRHARTNTTLEIQGQTTRMLASAVAAILLAGTGGEKFALKAWFPFEVEAWPLSRIFLLDAGAYLTAFLIFSSLRYKSVKPRRIDRGSVRQRLRTGFRFLQHNPLLFHFGNASYVIFIFVIIQAFFLMPVYVQQYLDKDADIYAAGEVLFAIGAVLTGIGIHWVARRWNTVLSIILAMVLTVVVFHLCSFTRSLWIFLAFNFMLGMTNSTARILRITYLFDHVPNDVIGRTNSVFQAINILLRTAFTGLFSIAFFTRGDNITWAYFISGTFVLLAIFPLLFYYKGLQGLRVRHPE